MRARRAGRRCPLGPLVRWFGAAADGVAAEDSVRPESKLSNCWECCLVFSCTNLHRILQRKYI
jgi:hypothetical protein